MFFNSHFSECIISCVINSVLTLVITLERLLDSAWTLLKTISRSQPLLYTQDQSSSTRLVDTPICWPRPFKCPRCFSCNPVWSRMSRQLSQLPTPDLPAGASPQFGSCTQPAGSLTGGHLNSMTGLKSLLQHPMKGDQRLKAPCDVKGENLSHVIKEPNSMSQCCSWAALLSNSVCFYYVQ